MSRIVESASADTKKADQAAGIETYDYVKPPRENAREAKPRFETKDHIREQEIKPLIVEPSPVRKSVIETKPSETEKAKSDAVEDTEKSPE